MAYVKLREIYGGEVKEVTDVKAARLVRNGKGEICPPPRPGPLHLKEGDVKTAKRITEKKRKVKNADSSNS